MKHFITIWLLYFSIFGLSAQTVVINEFMSSNYLFLLDSEGESSDWIEIFNQSQDTVNLGSYFLSDNPEKIYKWQFPDVKIAPDSFLVVFASGKDTVLANGEIHTNFSIKAQGEPLILSDSLHTYQIIDPVILKQNQSFGLMPDGIENAVVFELASPGKINEIVAVEKVIFSKSGGIYPESIMLELNCVFDNNEIYYTLDGSRPDTNSIKYAFPILLDKSKCSNNDIYKIKISPDNLYYIPDYDFPKAIVVRAACFDSLGNNRSKIGTQTYFIEDFGISHSELPIISLTVNNFDLFDDSTGIFVPGIYFETDSSEWTGNYYQHGIDWEKLANVEMYDASNNCVFNEPVGLRTHGGNIRRMPQKGMRFYARGEYGASQIIAKVFEDSELMVFDNLILRPFSSSWSNLGFQDYIFQQIASNLHCNSLRTRPVCVYLNAEYWGVYFLQERVDEHFIENNFDIDRQKIDIIDNWFGNVSCGDNVSFLDLYDFLKSSDLSDNQNYYYISNHININNLIDYYLLEIFSANCDWPANNMRCWSEKENVNWQWVAMDGDACFGNPKYNSFKHAINTSDDYWPTNAESTLLFRSLMENKSFFMSFIARFQDLAKTHFSFTETSSVLYQIANIIEPELQNQSLRFGFPKDYDLWVSDFYKTEEFLATRICEIDGHFKKVFDYRLELGNCDDREVVLTQFDIYPNPNQGSFTIIASSDFAGPFSIAISDVTGKMINSKQDYLYSGNNVYEFYDLQLESGVYFVNLIFAESISSKKLIVIN